MMIMLNKVSFLSIIVPLGVLSLPLFGVNFIFHVLTAAIALFIS